MNSIIPADTSPDGVEAVVKPEPTEDALPRTKTRERTQSHELHIYTQEELGRFKKKELVADTELLDGIYNFT